MNFIKNANLPDRKVSCVVVDGKICEDAKNTLKSANIKIIYTKAANGITSSIKSHPDIVLHHLGGSLFVCEPTVFSHFDEKLGALGAKIVSGNTILDAKYPKDCAYNVARAGGSVFLNANYSDKAILDFDNENYTRKINIKQGYAKCSICIVCENAIITSDDGIFKAAKKNGFDALKISSGNILLDGFNYGFIGGASGLLSYDTMAFFGNISLHPDCENIKAFLKNYGIYTLALCGGELVDYGSIIPIQEM